MKRIFNRRNVDKVNLDNSKIPVIEDTNTTTTTTTSISNDKKDEKQEQQYQEQEKTHDLKNEVVSNDDKDTTTTTNTTTTVDNNDNVITTKQLTNDNSNNDDESIRIQSHDDAKEENKEVDNNNDNINMNEIKNNNEESVLDNEDNTEEEIATTVKSTTMKELEESNSITILSYNDDEENNEEEEDDDEISTGFISKDGTIIRAQQHDDALTSNTSSSSLMTTNTAITATTMTNEGITNDTESTLQNIRNSCDYVDTTITEQEQHQQEQEYMIIKDTKDKLVTQDNIQTISSTSVITNSSTSLVTEANTILSIPNITSSTTMMSCNSSHSSDTPKTKRKKRKNRINNTNTNNLSLDKAQRIDEIGHGKYLENKLDESLEAYSLSLKIKTCLLLKGDDISFADTIQGMGDIYYKQKEYNKAITAYQEVVRLRVRIHLPSLLSNNDNDDDQDNTILDKCIKALDMLSTCMEKVGDINNANIIRNEQYIILQKRYNNNDNDSNLNIANVLEIIAMNHLELEHYEESLVHFLQALRIKRRVLQCNTNNIDQHNDNDTTKQNKHNSSIATTLNLIGNVYFAKLEYENAMEAFIESFDIRRKILGPDHIESSNSLSNIGNVLMAMSRFAEALTMYQQASDIRKKKLGDRHISIASSLNDIADAYASLEQYPYALRKYSESYKMYKKILGSHHPDVANAVYNMAKMHKNRNHLEKAKNRFMQGGNIHLYNKCIEDALWNFSRALECALSLRTASNNKTLTSSTTTIITSNNINDEEDYALANKLLWIAAILQWKIQNKNESIKAYATVLSLLQQMKGNDHIDVSYIHQHLGYLYQQLYFNNDNNNQQEEEEGFDVKALYHYEEALRIKKECNNKHNNKLISCHDIPLLTNIALLYKQQNNIDKAIEYTLEISKLKTFRLGTKHISLATTQRCIGLLYYEKGNSIKALEYLQYAIKIVQKHTHYFNKDNNNKSSNNSTNNNNNNNMFNPIQMATMLHEIGEIQYDQENYSDVVHSYKNAFKIWSTLMESEEYMEINTNTTTMSILGSHNDTYVLPTLTKQRFADARFKLGISLSSIGEYKDAVKEFKESLRLRRSCENNNNNATIAVVNDGDDNNSTNNYKPFIADTLIELGTCSLKVYDMEQSESYYKEALAIRKELLQQVKHRISLENSNNESSSSFSVSSTSLNIYNTKKSTFGIRGFLPMSKRRKNYYQQQQQQHYYHYHQEPNDEILYALEQVILILFHLSNLYEIYNSNYDESNDKNNDNIDDHRAVSTLQNARYLAHAQRGGYLLEARVLDKVGIFYAKYDKKHSLAYSSWEDAIALRKLQKKTMMTITTTTTTITDENDNDDHVENSFSLIQIGNLYYKEGSYGKAMKSFDDAISIQIKNNGKDHLQVMDCHRNIGKVFYVQKDYSKAKESYTEALRIAKLHHGVNSSQVADLLFDVALTQTKLEQYKEAISLYIGCATIHQENLQFEKALKAYFAAIQVPIKCNNIDENKLGAATNQDQLSSAKKLESFGHSLLFTESKEDVIDFAIIAYTEVVRVYRELLGKEHIDVVAALEIIGDIYNKKSDFDGALQSYLEVLKVKRQMYGNTSIDVANVLSKVADIYLHKKKYDNAIDTYNDVLFLNQQLRGGDHPCVSSTIRNIGLVYRANNDNVTALGFLQNAMVKVKHTNENNLDVAIIANDIGGIYLEEKRYREALTSYLEVLDVRYNMIGCDCYEVGEAHGKVGRCYALMGDDVRAILSFQEYLRIHKLQDDIKKKQSVESRSKDESQNAIIYQYLGGSYLNCMEFAEATNAYIVALKIRKEILSNLQIESSLQATRSKSSSTGSATNDDNKDLFDQISNGSKDVVTLLASIARIYEKRGNTDAALQYYLECKNHRVNISVDSLPILIEAYIKIGDLYRDDDVESTNNSIQTFSEALSMQRQWISLKKSELAKSVRMIKGVLYKSNKYESALWAFKTSQRGLASLYYKVGVRYKENKDYEKGLETLKEALRFSELEYGAGHLHLAIIHDTIGYLHAEFYNYNSSLAQFQLSLGIRRQQLGDDDIQVANTLYRIACVLESNEDYELSLDAFQEVSQILRYNSKNTMRSNANDPLLADTYVKIAEISLTLEILDEAQKYYEEALVLRKKELHYSRESLRRSIEGGNERVSDNIGPHFLDNQEYQDSATSVQKSARDVANILSTLDDIARKKGVTASSGTSNKRNMFSNALSLYKDSRRMSQIGGDGGIVVVREEPEIILV